MQNNNKAEEKKPVHPVYKGWDSIKLIGRVRERFKELTEKGWDWRSFYNGWLEGRSGMLQEMQKEWDAPSRPVCTCEHGPTDSNSTCSYPNCYPEGGGAVQQKPEWIEATIPPEKEGFYTAVTFENILIITCYQYGRWEYDMEAGGSDAPDWVARYRPSTHQPLFAPAPEAQPIVDGKEMPEEIQRELENIIYPILKEEIEIVGKGRGTAVGHSLAAEKVALAMYHKMQEEIKEADRCVNRQLAMIRVVEKENSALKTDLLASRNKNNDDGMEIARLLAELKRCQENLTAMIDIGLQKSKRLDEVEKEMGDYRRVLEKIVSVHYQYYKIYGDNEAANHLRNLATEILSIFPQPTQNSNK